MATRSLAREVCFYAYDASTGLPKTGDSANFTLRWVKDGSASSLTNGSITEIDSTNLPGMYKVSVDATETNCDNGVLCGKSSTANVVIVPTFINFVRLPNADPGASSGLVILGTNYAGISLNPSSSNALELIAPTNYSALYMAATNADTVVKIVGNGTSTTGVSFYNLGTGIDFNTLTYGVGVSSCTSAFSISTSGNCIELSSSGGHALYMYGIHADGVVRIDSNGTAPGVRIEDCSSGVDITLCGAAIAISNCTTGIDSSTTNEFLSAYSSASNVVTMQSLSGYGIYVDATNDAIYLLSSSGNGLGVYSNNGHGIDLQAPNENAINIHNSSLGISMQTTGYGIYIDSSASTGISILGATNGISVTGNNGIVLNGLSGAGLSSTGTTAGCYFVGATNGHGMRLAKAGTGLDLKLDNNSSGTWPTVQGYATGMYPLQATVEGNTLNVSASGLADADIKAIDGSTAAATNQSAAARTVYKGTITGTATTTTLIDSGLTQTTTNHWRGRVIIFLSGVLAYQATDITGFDPSNDRLTFTALTAAPSVADTYIIV